MIKLRITHICDVCGKEVTRQIKFKGYENFESSIGDYDEAYVPETWGVGYKKKKIILMCKKCLKKYHPIDVDVPAIA
jgi:hypothetical protein